MLISRIDRRNAAARAAGPCSGFASGGGVGVFIWGEGVLGWGDGVLFLGEGVLVWGDGDLGWGDGVLVFVIVPLDELDDELLDEDRERPRTSAFVTSSRGEGVASLGDGVLVATTFSVESLTGAGEGVRSREDESRGDGGSKLGLGVRVATLGEGDLSRGEDTLLMSTNFVGGGELGRESILGLGERACVGEGERVRGVLCEDSLV